MRVVITGGSGAIGSFVTRALHDHGHEVTVFDIEDPGISGVTYEEGDITDADSVTAAIDPADAVVHLAALLPDACQTHPRQANAVNVGGTLNVLTAAADSDTRVVYASSKAAIGPVTGKKAHPTYEPISEDIVRNPSTTYGITKVACEDYAREYRADGLDVVGLRFASTYGPGKGSAHGNLAYLPNLIRQAAAGEPITIEGGDQANDFVYYKDIARGVVKAIEAEDLVYPIYHIGSGRTTQMRRFAKALETQTGTTVNVEDGLNYRNADSPSYCRLDICRAESNFGYTPEYGPVEAVNDFLTTL